jgi:hypothetical protein
MGKSSGEMTESNTDTAFVYEKDPPSTFQLTEGKSATSDVVSTQWYVMTQEKSTQLNVTGIQSTVPNFWYNIRLKGDSH